MIIFIPLGGSGIRFKEFDYKDPKALITVENRPIIFWLLDNLINSYISLIDYIYIAYNSVEYKDYGFESVIKYKYNKITFKFLQLHKPTKGALETLSIALENIKDEPDCPILSLDADNFYLCNIIKQWDGKNIVFTFNDYNITNTKPKFSYISKNNENVITDIKEKEHLFNVDGSLLACTGAYGFKSFKELYNNSLIVLNDNIYKTNNEFYISAVIKHMMKEHDFKNITIENKNYFSLGTPEQIEEFKYIFLLDLDGTLVDTDEVYCEVWRQLLESFDITVDLMYYCENIKSKDDKHFLKMIFPSITYENIKKISLKKNELFLKNINKVKIYENVICFLQQLSNIRTAIVTNCNKDSADAILKHFNIEQYINIVISSDDCIHAKPNKEPYINALKFFKKTDLSKCIVFEDSLTGYTSAINACIVNNNIYIKTNYFDIRLDALKTNKFLNYSELNIKDIINKLEHKNILKDSFDKVIYQIIDENIKNSGYICNINKYNLTFEDADKNSIIIKQSNYNNPLSETAISLDLYENELIFYSKLSPNIKNIINIAKCHNVLKKNKQIYLVLEDLTMMDGIFNINLNNNINVLKNVIDEITKMHVKYYFRNDNEIPGFLDDVKFMKDFEYYSKLVDIRYDLFLKENEIYLSSDMKKIFKMIKERYNKTLYELSSYPLSLCHGDLKSPNIFYKDMHIPYLLDFQYINLSKGITDIVFLLVESVDFDKGIYDDIIKYYYNILISNNIKYSEEEYQYDIKNAFSAFPFFVALWFNTENKDKLNDKDFPLKFLKKLIKYYEYIFIYKMIDILRSIYHELLYIEICIYYMYHNNVKK